MAPAVITLMAIRIMIPMAPSLISSSFLLPNVSVHRRRTLCAVRCDALFNAFIFPDFHARKSKISIIRPENRVLGLVEPIFSIFRPFFEVIFGFRGIARIFIRIFFLCSRGRRYFTVISDISGR